MRKKVFDSLRKSRVFVFGAWIVGMRVMSVLMDNDIEVDAFCDSEFSKQESEFGNRRVLSIEELLDKYRSDQISIIIAHSDVENAISMIDGKDSVNWYIMPDIFDIREVEKDCNPSDLVKLKSTWYAQKSICDQERTIINSLDFVLTEKCSLRCRECSNLMQYYHTPQNFEGSKLISDLKKLLSVCDWVYELRLIGGEPFVYPELEIIIDYLPNFSNLESICIYTNGTICPKDTLLKKIAEKKIWLSISNYGKLSKKLDELVNRLDIYNIYYEIKDIDFWTKCSSINKRNRSEHDLMDVYKQCCVKHCLTLLDGTLYPCPFIANGLNLRALPQEMGNFISVRDTAKDVLGTKIKDTLFSRDYFTLCDYCNGRPRRPKESQKILPNEQTDKSLDYHRY